MDYFNNSVVVVTGAASGIGQQLAIQASHLGAVVIATDINESGLDKTRKAANDIRTQPLDVSDKIAIQQFADDLTPALNGRKLILINNAGVALLSGSFHETSVEDIEWLFNINFWGVVRMTKAFYPYFISRNQGHIVNISSVFGLGGFSNQSAYSPSKFAVRGFTETLRMELIGTGICTTTVHPGGINTAITSNAKARGRYVAHQHHSIKEFAKVAGTSPEKAARTILDGVTRKKQRILIGNDARMIDIATRLFPVAYSTMADRRAKKLFSEP
jgi:NAD(P)-dependent dehydrogenase (short-subunit alcohol dehydrogenase family)